MSEDKKPRKSRQSREKRRAILSAGQNLFLTNGYSTTSMDDLAEAAGVSKRTVYNHFASKEELFCAIIQDLCSEVMPPEMSMPESPDTTAEDHLTAIGEVFLRSLYTNTQIKLLRTVISEAERNTKVAHYMLNGPVESSHRVVEAYLERLVGAGDVAVNDTDLAASQFLGMLKTDIQLKLLLNDSVKPSASRISKIARECANLFLQGAKPKDD